MIADVAGAVASEGVPEWVKWVGGTIGTLIVAPIVAVVVRALAKRLGVSVPDDPPGGTHRATEDRGTPATRTGPEQSGQEAPAERYDAKMAMIERAFQRQDEQIVQLATQLAAVMAERDQLRWAYEQATGRPAPGPPPGLPRNLPWPQSLPYPASSPES